MIRVVTLTPEDVELWDSPNKLVAAAVMLTAAATGHQRPKLGDKAHVGMRRATQSRSRQRRAEAAMHLRAL